MKSTLSTWNCRSLLLATSTAAPTCSTGYLRLHRNRRHAVGLVSLRIILFSTSSLFVCLSFALLSRPAPHSFPCRSFTVGFYLWILGRVCLTGFAES